MNQIDLKGAIQANAVYNDGDLVAKDVTATLPAITPATADIKAMGTMTVPVIGQFDSMEMTITKIGTDMGLTKLCAFKSTNLEFRFIQNVVKPDGTIKSEGCKAFVRAIPKGIPGINIEPGAAQENEITLEATRYQLFVGGEEILLIDRLAQILLIGGIDYYSELASLL